MTNANRLPENALAIIGMAGRFPKANNVAAFWENLCQGVEGVTFFSDADLLAGGVNPALLAHPNYVKARAVIEDPAGFDAAFFGLHPREAELTDPQQRVFLECAWEALEQAGYVPEKTGVRIGLFAGSGSNGYLIHNLLPNQALLEDAGQLQVLFSNDKDYLTTRTAYKLNLKGPSVTVQTACSTSLVAVHLACQSLLNQECDLALAGGASLSIPQECGYIYQEGDILSPDGHCRPFDARAQGTVTGSGAGVVVLKRLEEALSDGDLVYAVILGSAINNDGADKVGFTAPSVEGQAGVIAEALAVAGVNPATMGYVEAHGTGTSLGDPIEIEALTLAYRASTQKKGYCAIGAVKSNIGHLDAAAGVAGLMKTALALYHRQIPPSLNFEQPNSKIDFANSPFFVNTQLAAWTPGPHPRRAGVSSFGIGGTNAHIVLEEAPSQKPSEASRAWQLILLSAKTPTALDRAAANLADHLARCPELNLGNVAYTLQVGRQDFQHRRILVCQTSQEAVQLLREPVAGRVFSGLRPAQRASVAFVFPGQGSQYVGMAQGLYASEPVFRQHLESCAQLLRPALGLDLCSLLFPPAEQRANAANTLQQTAYAQPALFAVEYSLAQLWLAWGLRPQAMLGHSLGEYVAACLAGIFSLPDALHLVTVRGQLMQSIPPGSMLAVPVAEDQLQLPAGLSLAAVNAPTQCVISGPGPAIQAYRDWLAQQGLEGQLLATSHAFHSEMMEPMLAAFTREVAQTRRSVPQIPFVSNLTGSWITAEQALDAAYWGQHLRQTVRFWDGLKTLLDGGERVVLEVGPGKSLSSLARRHGQARGLVPSLRHVQEERADEAVLLEAVGKLWLSGVKIDWEGYRGVEPRGRVALPTYPFERKRYWIEPPRWNSHRAASPVVEQASVAAEAIPEQGDSESIETQSAHPAMREERIIQTLLEIVENLFGIQVAGSDLSLTLLELGLDSLALLRVRQKIQDIFKVQVTFAELLQDAASIRQLASYLDRTLPADAALTALPPPQKTLQDQPSLEDVISAEKSSPASGLLVPSWKRAVPLNPLGERMPPGNWLVMTDDGAFCTRLIRQLRDAGHRVAEVVINEQFEQLAESKYGVRPQERDDYRTLLEMLLSKGQFPEQIGHFWNVTSPIKQVSPDQVDGELIRSFYSLLALAQALEGLNRAEPLKLCVLSNGLFAVTGEESLCPQKAALLGPCKVIPQEMPSIACRAIDISLPAGGPVESLAKLAYAELIHTAGEPLVALRGSHRWIPAAEPVSLPDRAEDSGRLRESGVYLITGGLGGMGLTFAEFLARSVQAKLVLIGRTVLPPRESWPTWIESHGEPDPIRRKLQKLQEIEQLGGQVLYYAADVACRDEMEAAVAAAEAQFGAIHGILHTAGVPAQGIISLKTPEMAAKVLAPKINGTLIIEELFQGKPLDFFALCSSISALIGGLGQVDYCAANAFLDAFAQSRFQPERPVISIDWNAWREVGMAAEAPGQAAWKHAQQQNLTNGLSPVQGADILSRVLPSPFCQVIVAGGLPSENETRMTVSTPHSRQAGFQVFSGQEIPLTDEQQQAWVVAQMGHEASLSHNGSLILRIHGRLDRERLQLALQTVVDRHGSLRVVFSPDGSHQRILPQMPIEIPLVDFSASNRQAQEGLAAEWLLQEIDRPFNLSQAPLLHCSLARLEDERHILALTVHHIIADGRSMSILIDEIGQIYNAAGQGKFVHLPPAVPFHEYAQWTMRQARSPEMAEAEAFWLDQLKDPPSLIKWPLEHPLPQIQTYGGARLWLSLETTLFQALKKLSAQQGCTLYMTMLAAYHLLIYQLTYQTEFVVAVVSIGQLPPNSQSFIGFTANLLPVRSRLDLNRSFLDYLSTVKQILLKSYAYQMVPIARLVKVLNPQRDLTRPPIFNTIFNLEPSELAGLNQHIFEGLDVQMLECPVACAQVDLEWDLLVATDWLKIQCTYNVDLFDAETIHRWMSAYQALLTILVEQPHLSLTEACQRIASCLTPTQPINADREEGEL
ncbi:MAG: SDR family NAD(P)-dependent oxidoreductase [Chloroflexota bacterium]